MSFVTVIVPVYNTPKRFLKPCLDSIAAQTMSCNVIIVDDHSRHFTRDYLRLYCLDKPDWQVISHRKNRGVAWARNTALSRVETKYTAICDADDVWSEDKLYHQVKDLEIDNAYAIKTYVNICGVTVDYRNETDYPLTERTAPVDFVTDLKDDSDYLKSEKLIYKVPSHLSKSLLRETSVESLSSFTLEETDVRAAYTKLIRFNASLCGSNALFDTVMLRSVGGFDQRLNGADEWDALLKVAAIGNVSVTPKNLLRYVRHTGSFSTTKLKHLRSVCEDIIYKHRKNLNDSERVLLQSVEVAQWATDFEKLTFAPGTPYKIIQYHG